MQEAFDIEEKAVRGLHEVSFSGFHLKHPPKDMAQLTTGCLTQMSFEN
jgi:hypothetical protein